MSKLTILRASAGSGKTYNLSRNFLMLLFSRPGYYKHILAVTFTNKATEEMKSRVLFELSTIASNPTQSSHLSYIAQKLKRSEEKVISEAEIILQDILNDHSHFSISTIDRFFQRIIRSFIREIGYTQLYNIELDSDSVIEEATDLLFFELSKETQPKILKWLSQFSDNQIKEGKSWKIKPRVLALGKDLLKESSGLYNNPIGKEGLGKLEELQTELFATNKAIQQKFNAIISQIEDGLRTNNLTLDDFSYKKSSGLAAVFKYQKLNELGATQVLLGTRTLTCINEPEKHCAKASKKRDVILQFADSTLTSLLLQIQDLVSGDLKLYLTNKVVLQNLYTLGVMYYLNDSIKSFTKANNLMLLSNSNRFINKIINNSDTPFIYEKTGTNYYNYLIDEFQDTSKLQWSNFKPLLTESIANQNNNLVVGDEKQAIYRWRNSDWQLLAKHIDGHFRPDNLNKQNLDSNYRSYENVVKFNNSFFEGASSLLAKEDEENSLVKEAYKNAIQKQGNATKCDGEVNIRFLSSETKEEFETESLALLKDNLNQIINKGKRLKDIAILTRKTGEAALISSYLTDQIQDNKTYKGEFFRVISNDSFFLKNSLTIQFLMLLFSYEANESSFTLFEIEQLYCNHLLKFTKLEFDFTQLNDHLLNDSQVLQRNITGKLYYYLELFQLNTISNETLFIQTFVDYVKSYEENRSSNLSDFCDHYRKSASGIRVSQSSDQDAINVLTIHKSKGLEFPIVLIPIMHWPMGFAKNQGNYIWHPFPFKDDIIQVPINATGLLEHTIMADSYKQELELLKTDNLNLMYVAFTRAEEALYITSWKKEKDSSSTSSVLYDTLKDSINTTNENCVNLSSYFNEEDRSFLFGSLPETQIEELEKTEIEVPKIRELFKGLHLRSQVNSSKKGINSKAKEGRVLHAIFEDIKTADDIIPVLQRKNKSGLLNKEQFLLYKEYLTQLLTDHPLVKEWFNTHNTVWNERDIITKKGEVYRPDRVVLNKETLYVIDYKFGKNELDKYIDQVAIYKSLFEEMGYVNVKAYIWYVSNGRIIEA